MEWFEGIILGLIQGLAEFLPISSSGHLLIAKELLHINLPSDDVFLSFEVIVHAATVLATIVIFYREIWDLLKGLFKFQYNEQTEYVCKILVSMIPVFIVGVFFKDLVASLFSGVFVVGCALLVTALLLMLSDIFHNKIYRGHINYWQAFVIGIAQAVAVIPGLSRSGSTIAVGLLSGVRRHEVAQFSFLMVLAPILGEALLDLKDGGFMDSVHAIGGLPLFLGFVTAFVSGLLSCKAMIALVRKASLKWFAVYCAIVGFGVLFVYMYL